MRLDRRAIFIKSCKDCPYLEIDSCAKSEYKQLTFNERNDYTPNWCPLYIIHVDHVDRIQKFQGVK
ncbi:hypothetical protein M0R04_04730 [Candidatus Dojkabacteria bacterium]|jgi:hypothetical protein|nr:hypothetical protein [Candidatus Dojkabacteria bacterium]